jgi:integrase
MRGTSKSLPKYRKHKKSGQAVVTLSGVDHYLGPHGTKASKTEYDRLVAEWLSRGRTLEVQADSITVSELILKFMRWGKVHYRRNGKPTETLENHRYAFRTLRRYYGRKLANEFGPKSLKALQKVLVDEGLARRTVNDRITSIKLLFKWGVSEQLVSPMVSHGLSTVPGLTRGRSEARETDPVQPVDDSLVDATIPHLPPAVKDMVALQRLTGCRPAEICIMRPCDVDRSGEVWLYRPSEHKTQHHGHDRIVAIGPQGQAILFRYLARDPEDFCFAPWDSEAKRRAARHELRVVPIKYGNRPGTNLKRSPKWAPGRRYSTDSYRKAIHRACEKAGVEQWSPNQLRHAAATAIRKRFGLESAQVALGHATAEVTQVYAERDLARLVEVAKQIG